MTEQQDKPRWVFNDPDWWADTIWSALGSRCLGSPLENLSVTNNWCSAVASYAAVLRWLDIQPASTNIRRLRAPFFVAKAMRKWKFADPSLAKNRRNAALDGFITRNSVAAVAPPVSEPFRTRMRELLRRWLPDPKWDEFTRIYGRFGPGQVAERLTHAERASLLVAGARSIWLDPFSPIDTSRCNWGDSEPLIPDSVPPKRLRASILGRDTARLCAVPKTFDKDRLITVEPVLNSFRQQLCRRVLYESIHSGPLRGTAMDAEYVDGAQEQRRLALEASLRRNMGTLDVKDASDNIPWTHVQDLFPEWVSRALSFARSNAFEDPRDRRVYPLHIYAGMGNATTFVVETLYFAALVASAHWCLGAKKIKSLPADVSVFGDDVIASVEVCQYLAEAAIRSFPVNTDKSFYTGNLRESCGIFAHAGQVLDVPKIDGYADDWVGRQGIAELVKALAEDDGMFHPIVATIMAEKPVPNYPFLVDGGLCVSVPWLPFADDPPMRMNHDLQRVEVQVRQLEPVCENVPCFEEVGYPRREASGQLAQSLLAGGSEWRTPCDATRIDCSQFPIGTSRQITIKGRPYVPYPIKDRFRARNRWLRVVPLP